MSATYTIGDLAREFGVTTRTIRHYEHEGLLNPTRQGTARIFSARDRVRLKLALRGKRLGFTLQEIKELVALDASEDRGRVRELANARVEALDARIVELQRVRDALRRLARECGEGTSGPCPILTSFEA